MKEKEHKAIPLRGICDVCKSEIIIPNIIKCLVCGTAYKCYKCHLKEQHLTFTKN